MSELDVADLATVDVVQKMDVLLDYQAALRSVQEAAEELACGFVKDGQRGDTMLPQVKECLTAALAEWYVRARYSKRPWGFEERIRDLLESGFAEYRLNRMLAALDAAGFVFRIGEDARLSTLVRFVDLIAENAPPPIPTMPVSPN